jgi:hypothetical protein
MLRTSLLARPDHPAKMARRRITWSLAIVLLLAGAVAGAAYLRYQADAATPVVDRLRSGELATPGQAALPGLGLASDQALLRGLASGQAPPPPTSPRP